MLTAKEDEIVMTPETSFNSGVVAPIECLKAGWATIKDQYLLFLGLTLVAVLLGGAVPVVLIGPMMCGLYMCVLGRMRGEPIEFGMLFKGFDYFVPALIAAAIQSAPGVVLGLISGVISFGFSLATMQHDRSSGNEGLPIVFWGVFSIFMVIIMIVSLVMHTLFFFSYPLIVDRKLSGMDAIKTSYRAATKNIGGVVGLILLSAAMTFVGVLCCYVGAFLVMPITFAAQAFAYRQVFPDIQPTMPSPPPPPGSWAA